jgi:hypothetical protein
MTKFTFNSIKTPLFVAGAVASAIAAAPVAAAVFAPAAVPAVTTYFAPPDAGGCTIGITGNQPNSQGPVCGGGINGGPGNGEIAAVTGAYPNPVAAPPAAPAPTMAGAP